ncbi:MAG: hypothetical protein SFT90_05605 [Rickettsiales bacterium]|nr:hypothetical protein [Rickettsiales bacterium]
MEITQILSAFNLGGDGRNLPKEAQQNIAQNLSSFLANQVFRGETLQNVAGNYSTQVIINPEISNLSQELTFRTNADLKAIGNFSVEVENINFNQTSSNSGAINFTGKIISENPANSGQAYQLNGSIKITDPKILAFLSTSSTPSEVQQNVVNRLVGYDVSNFSKLPNNLQVQLPNNSQNLQNFLTQNNFANVTASNASLNISQITGENGDILLQNNTSLGKANIFGKLEFLPASNETLIKTEYGNFRINGSVNIPTNSNLVFNVEVLSNQQNSNNIGNNSPVFSSLYLLKSAVESDVVNLQNYSKLLMQNPVGVALLEKAFPNVKDASSAFKSIVALSSLKNSEENFLDNINLSAKMQNLPMADRETMDTARNLISAILQSAIKIGNSEGEVYYSYILPFFNGERLDFHRVFVSQNKNSKGKNKSEGRFLMELVENEQGKIEIEGNFFTLYNRVKTLDIVIRSEENFSDNTKSEMLDLYNNVSESMGYSGRITFQTLPVFSANPPKPSTQPTPTSLNLDV